MNKTKEKNLKGNIYKILEKVYEEYESNDALKNNFINHILNLSCKELLWPEENIKSFPKDFLVKFQNTYIVIFLYKLEDRLYFLDEKLRIWLQEQLGRYEHPYIIYYYVQKFYEEITSNFIDKTLRKATEEIIKEIKLKNKSTVNKKIYREEININHIETLIEKIKKKLKVPKTWKNLNSTEIHQELLKYFEEISVEKFQLEKEKVNLEIELEHYKNPNFIHPSYKKEIENYKTQIQQLQKDILQERSKNEILEKEVQRLTELIIENPTLTNQQEELETLKKEYNLLAEKYDLLVSKNIELRNLLEQQSYVKSLHEILNKIRDRINKVLKTGGLSEEVLIIKIKQEIEELQRARIYLGKALYDLGLLYLRVGKKEEALIELKAARQLGIEDPEVNRIINQE